MTTSTYFRKIEKTCPNCGKVFLVKPSHDAVTKYCSKSCMAAGYKMQLRGNSNPNFKGITKRCEQCGVTYRNYNKASKYCSASCYHQSRIISDEYVTERAWKKKNKGKVAGYAQKRRHIKKSLPHTFTSQEWETCLQYWDYRCAYCGKREGLFAYSKIQQEHYIPVSDTRPDNPGYTKCNILPACCGCNTSKNDQNAEVWIVKTFGKRLGNQIISNIKEYFSEVTLR